MLTITGFGRLGENDEGNDVRCGCCGREIKHLAYMSNGQVWGRACALKCVKLTKSALNGIPTVMTISEALRARVWGGALLVHFHGEIAATICRRVAADVRVDAVQLTDGTVVDITQPYNIRTEWNKARVAANFCH